MCNSQTTIKGDGVIGLPEFFCIARQSDFLPDILIANVDNATMKHDDPH